jgi:hypothetical protein
MHSSLCAAPRSATYKSLDEKGWLLSSLDQEIIEIVEFDQLRIIKKYKKYFFN